MLHALKIEQEYFKQVADGSKGFEVRKNDRPYKVGDFLALNEWKDQEHTGKFILAKITYILDDPQYCKDGFVILSIKPHAIQELNDIPLPSLRCNMKIPVY